MHFAASKNRAKRDRLASPLPFQADLRAINRFAHAVRDSYDTVCLLGIGGSALGAWALECGLRGPHPVQGPWTQKHPRLVILDNVDPDFVNAALDSMNPKKTGCRQIGIDGGNGVDVPHRTRLADARRGKVARASHRRGHLRRPRRLVHTRGAPELTDLLHPRKRRRAPQRAFISGPGSGGPDRHRYWKTHARRTRDDPPLLAGRSPRKQRAARRPVPLPAVDAEAQADPGGVSGFEPAVGHGLLVPAALGGIAGKIQETAKAKPCTWARRRSPRSALPIRTRKCNFIPKVRTTRCSLSGPWTSPRLP